MLYITHKTNFVSYRKGVRLHCDGEWVNIVQESNRCLLWKDAICGFTLLLYYLKFLQFLSQNGKRYKNITLSYGV
jgi:hypothetical protein